MPQPAPRCEPCGPDRFRTRTHAVVDNWMRPVASPDMTKTSPGSQTLRRILTWRDGGTDLWPLLSDPQATSDVVAALAEPFEGEIDLVAGPEPGGILFGPLVARALRVPFAPVCRDRAFFFQGPHESVSVATERGELLMHRAALSDKARVLLVDDWSESGTTVTGVARLVAATTAKLLAVSFVVDSLRPAVRRELEAAGVALHAVATADQLTRV